MRYLQISLSVLNFTNLNAGYIAVVFKARLINSHLNIVYYHFFLFETFCMYMHIHL